MYLDGLSFLEEEREAWRPFEALADLSDDQLVRPVDGAHGWNGRELMVHTALWYEIALQMAREYALGPTSPTHERMRAAWDEGGDALNFEYIHDCTLGHCEEHAADLAAVLAAARG